RVQANFGAGTTISQLTVLPDGELALCGSMVGTAATPTLRPYSGTCIELVGDPRGAHLVRGGTGTQTGDIHRWDPGTSTYVPAGFVAARIAGTSSTWFANSNGWRVFDGDSWVAVAPPGCSLRDVVANGSDIVAVGGCTGVMGIVVFDWDGDAFQQ